MKWIKLVVGFIAYTNAFTPAHASGLQEELATVDNCMDCADPETGLRSVEENLLTQLQSLKQMNLEEVIKRRAVFPAILDGFADSLEESKRAQQASMVGGGVSGVVGGLSTVAIGLIAFSSGGAAVPVLLPIIGGIAAATSAGVTVGVAIGSSEWNKFTDDMLTFQEMIATESQPLYEILGEIQITADYGQQCADGLVCIYKDNKLEFQATKGPLLILKNIKDITKVFDVFSEAVLFEAASELGVTSARKLTESQLQTAIALAKAEKARRMEALCIETSFASKIYDKSLGFVYKTYVKGVVNKVARSSLGKAISKSSSMMAAVKSSIPAWTKATAQGILGLISVGFGLYDIISNSISLANIDERVLELRTLANDLRADLQDILTILDGISDAVASVEGGLGSKYDISWLETTVEDAFELTAEKSVASTCQCEFVSRQGLAGGGGCRITTPAPAGFGCKCIDMGRFCNAEVVMCKEIYADSCVTPTREYTSCLQGDGNCAGYDVCDCNWSAGGCHLSKAAPPGSACKCSVYLAGSTCRGTVVSCRDPNSNECAHPKKDALTCLQAADSNCWTYEGVIPDGQRCYYDSNCKSDYCKDGTCRSKNRKEGESCPEKSDKLCATGKCAQHASGDYRCCASGDDHWYVPLGSVLQFCKKLANNKGCDWNGQCSSGFCKAGKCQPKLQEGQSCPSEDNAACESGRCGRGRSSNYQCCSSRDSYTKFGGIYEWCTNIAIGHSCDENSQCKSGNCVNGKCSQAKAKVGESCSTKEDASCSSGKCAQYANWDYRCCKSGSSNWYVPLGYTTQYCKGIDSGTTSTSGCMRNDQCSSGRCVFGKCAAKAEVGDSCSDKEDGTCDSGKCGRYASGDYRCCSSKNAFSHFGGIYQYCTGLSSGSTPQNGCVEHGQCKSGFCDGNRCKDKRKVNAVCPEKDDSSCSSGRCAQMLNNDYRCCPSNDYHFAYASQYCKNLDNGKECYLDSQCKSGWCSSKKCLSKKKVNDACSKNDQCASGMCNRTTRDGSYKCCKDTFYCYGWTSGNCKSSFYYCTGYLGH